jgi:DNA-binding beta-propeller fold protein YncE
MRARTLAAYLLCALLLAAAIGPTTAQGARKLLTKTAVQTTFCKGCDEPTPLELLNPVPPPEGQVEGPCGLAVDAAGRLLLSDYHHNTVNFFAGPELMFSGQTGGGALPPEGPCGLAAGPDDPSTEEPDGALYVNVWHQRVVRLEPTVQVFDTDSSTGVAVDAAGDVYVNDRTYVAVYEPSGAPVLDGGEPLKIGLGSLGEGFGVAVSSGRVYVPDAADQTVKVYEPAVDPLVPVAEIGCFNSLVDAAVTVDPTNGNLLVVDNLKPGFEHPQAAIFEFDSAGAFLDRLVGPVHGEPSGIVVDPETGVLFVTDGNGELSNVFAYGPFVPGSGGELECPLESEDPLGDAGGVQGAGVATGASSVAVARAPSFLGPRRSPKRPRKRARRGRGRVAIGSAVALPDHARR